MSSEEKSNDSHTGLPAFETGGPWDNMLNDPAILEMAQELQRDPSFQQMQQVLQQSFGFVGQGESNLPFGEVQGQSNVPTAPTDIDPQKAFEAMQKLYANPQFLQMAEKIGQTMLQQNPVMRAMMDPSKRDAMQEKFEELKKNPELAPVMNELESGDPQAMMKYWNNPDVLKKFSEAVQDVLGNDNYPNDNDAATEDEPLPSMQLYAGEGNIEGLKQLLSEGVNIDDKDEEGRTGLHFACGYGEIDCVNFFIENKADLNCCDNNKNTSMHYAAGYGQVEVVKILLKEGCDLSLKNDDGNTAMQVAELNEKKEIVSLLDKNSIKK